jgi:hypothetical protein
MGIEVRYNIALSSTECNAMNVCMVENSLEDAQKTYNTLRSVTFQSDETITVTQITTTVVEDDVTEYLEKNKSEFEVDMVEA